MQLHRAKSGDPNNEELQKMKFSSSSSLETSQERPALGTGIKIIAGVNQHVNQNIDQILKGEVVLSMPQGIALETMPQNPNKLKIDDNVLGKRVMNGE